METARLEVYLMLFAIGFFLYMLQSYFCYRYKAVSLQGLSLWWPVIGAAFGAASGALWFRLVWTSNSPEHLYLRGLWWDSMILFAYSVAPVALYGVRLTTTQWIGYGLVLIGIGFAR